MIHQEDLKEIIKKHENWLLGKNDAERADFTNAVLIDLVFPKGASLKKAIFTGADLTGTSFVGVNLSQACFFCANLLNANLIDSKLINTDFSHANLSRACLYWSDFKGANFCGACLSGAVLPDGIYQIVGNGFINRATTYDSVNDYVLCGCWSDNDGNHLDSFKRHIEKVYGPNSDTTNNRFYTEYMAAIIYFETVRKFKDFKKISEEESIFCRAI